MCQEGRKDKAANELCSCQNTELELLHYTKLPSASDKQLQYFLQGSTDSNPHLFWFNMTEHGNLFFYWGIQWSGAPANNLTQQQHQGCDANRNTQAFIKQTSRKSCLCAVSDLRKRNLQFSFFSLFISPLYKSSQIQHYLRQGCCCNMPDFYI